MRQRLSRSLIVMLPPLLLMVLAPAQPAIGQLATMPLPCQDLAFSTEEDFVTRGPEPPDGNPIISDGDLLSTFTDLSGNEFSVLCARNLDLVESFDVAVDLGLDAVDVVDAESALVVFSTELNSKNVGQFTHGDLLVTNGVIIQNVALTAPWQVDYDIGLDAVHFIGPMEEILRFLDEAAQAVGAIDPDGLAALFEKVDAVDILYSTEGTFTPLEAQGFLDGDLLSARTGAIVAAQKDIPPAAAPAGIPTDGVDFGLDSATLDREGYVQSLRGSTEILFRDEVAFTDGDVLRYGAGVMVTNADLLAPFIPAARELGLDALHMTLAPGRRIYLPISVKDYPMR